MDITNINSSQTFTIGCGLSGTSSVTVNVEPTATLTKRIFNYDSWNRMYSSGGAKIADGDQVQLKWSSTNAYSCEVTANDDSFSTEANGLTSAQDIDITEPATGSSTTYTIVCEGDGGTATDSLTITNAKPYIRADRKLVRQNSTSTITWSTGEYEVSDCNLHGGGLTGAPSNKIGASTTKITATTIFEIRCDNDNNDSVKVRTDSRYILQ